MFKLSSTAFACALGALTFAALPSRATVVLTVADNQGDIPIVATAPSNAIGLSVVSLGPQMLGNGVYLESATGMAATSSPFPASLQFNSIDLAVTGPATLTFTLSADGFTQAPAGMEGIHEQLSTTTVSNASVQLTGYEGTNLFDETYAGPTLTLSSPDASGISADSDATFLYGSPFSLTEVMTLSFTSAGSAELNFGGTLTPTPEPSSWLLFSTVLLGAGFLVHRRAIRCTREQA